MQCKPLSIPDVKLLTPKKHGDERGFFSETYNREILAIGGITDDFVQDNHSYSAQQGVLRGLHFQEPPFAQAKLVRVIRGAIWDVAVDIRHGSPTFGQWVAAELSAANWQQLYIPIGFAHGFVTLIPDTEVCYKTSNYYSPAHDGGILWSDAALNIPWNVSNPVLSAKDAKLPLLRDLEPIFKNLNTK